MGLTKKTVMILQFSSDMRMDEIVRVADGIKKEYGYAFSDLRPAVILE